MRDWLEADDEEDCDEAETKREKAYDEQTNVFRESYWSISDYARQSVEHWLRIDQDFKHQFQDFYGHSNYENELGYL